MPVADMKDAVMPVLKKIQDDLANGFKRVEAKMNDMAETLIAHGDRLEAIDANTTFHRGVTLQHQFDIKTLRDDVIGQPGLKLV